MESSKLEMSGVEEEQSSFKIGVVVPKRNVKAEEGEDCLEVLVNEFRNVGLIVQTVSGVVDDFIKVLVHFDLFLSLIDFVSCNFDLLIVFVIKLYH